MPGALLLPAPGPWGGLAAFPGGILWEMLLVGVWSWPQVLLQVQELCWCEPGPCRSHTVPVLPLVQEGEFGE